MTNELVSLPILPFPLFSKSSFLYRSSRIQLAVGSIFDSESHNQPPFFGVHLLLPPSFIIYIPEDALWKLRGQAFLFQKKCTQINWFYRVYYKSHKRVSTCLKKLLCIDIYSRKPASKAWMRVIPTDNMMSAYFAEPLSICLINKNLHAINV